MRADADGGLIFYIIIAIIGIVSSIIQKKGKQINQPHGGKEILTDFPELPYENDADTVQEEIKPLVNKPNTITPNNQYNEYLEKTIIQNNFYSKDIINEGLPAFSYEDEIK